MLRNLRHAVASYSPRWLSNRPGGLNNGAAILYTLGAVLDVMLEVNTQGVFAGRPSTAPSSALPAIGYTRNMIRGIGESDASYAARLPQWLDLARTAGRPVGLLLGTLFWALPSSVACRVVDNQGNWFWYNTGANPFPPGASTPVVPNFLLNQGNWNWDGDTTKWWRIWLIIYVGPLGWTVPGWHWGDGGHWGDAGRLWGVGGATAGQISALRSVCKQMKAAHSWLVNIILTTNTARFDPTHAAGGGVNPDGTWGNPANRFSDCAFLDGVI